MAHRRIAPLTALSVLALLPIACEDDPRAAPADGAGVGGGRCQSDADCPADAPFCEAGTCSVTDSGGPGEGGADQGGGSEGEGEGEGEGPGGGEGEGEGAGGPADGELCAPCEGVDDCGEEGRCILYRDQNKYCAHPCTEQGLCPEGFECNAGFGPDVLPQCVPMAETCVGNCAVEGCRGAGEICDYALGRCTTPKGHCEACVGDDECQGGACAQLQAGTYCVDECPAGGEAACPAGSSCAGTFCMPDEGLCDRCDGVECDGLTPFCEPTTGQCAGCLTDQDCGPSSYCGMGACREQQGECLSNGDCAGNPAGALCFVDRCVECIATEHCPPRSACEANACVDALCEGLLCQGGAACNAATGKCDPSCEQAGCLDGQQCDATTGQCYNSDGSCDADSQCRPGSRCGGAAGLPGQPAEGATCSCPSNIIQCASADDCVGFPGGCSQFGTCDIGCFGGDTSNCPQGWTCPGGVFCEPTELNDYCHPGLTCSAFGGTCGAG